MVLVVPEHRTRASSWEQMKAARVRLPYPLRYAPEMMPMPVQLERSERLTFLVLENQVMSVDAPCWAHQAERLEEDDLSGQAARVVRVDEARATMVHGPWWAH